MSNDDQGDRAGPVGVCVVRSNASWVMVIWEVYTKLAKMALFASKDLTTAKKVTSSGN